MKQLCTKKKEKRSNYFGSPLGMVVLSIYKKNNECKSCMLFIFSCSPLCKILFGIMTNRVYQISIFSFSFKIDDYLFDISCFVLFCFLHFNLLFVFSLKKKHPLCIQFYNSCDFQHNLFFLKHHCSRKVFLAELTQTQGIHSSRLYNKLRESSFMITFMNT